jgi:alcohol dehydrogenase class IV
MSSGLLVASVPVRPFVSPRRVLAGPGASADIGRELLGRVGPHTGTVLLVADSAVLKLGLTDPIVAAVGAAGFCVEVCAPVTGEPTPETVRAATATVVAGPVAAVVGVGGGSALDVAKLVALRVANANLDVHVGLAPTANLFPGPPLVAVPTTAGTGAEATAVAMLWNDGTKRMFVHPHLVPEIAVLDPDLLCGLPPAVTAAGGLDAISHAVEAMLSTFRTPLTESAARSALGLLGGAVAAAYETGDPAARNATLLGAYQAGLALNASVVLGHSIAYTIAARTGLPHGVTCAMALPYCLAHARPVREAAIAEMAGIVCDVADAEQLVHWLIAMNATMGIPPSLESVGIAAGALPEMVRECIELYPRPNSPVPVEAGGLHLLLRRFLRGEAMEAWREAGMASGIRGRQGARA